MRAEFQVARIFGIPIKIHWTLVLFIPLLGFLLALQLGQIAEAPLFREIFSWFSWVEVDGGSLTSENARLTAGFVAAVGLFVSVLLHELGHAVVALRHDIGVKQITLWLFGGIAMLDGITQDPKAEAKIAVAGPIVSLALGFMPIAFLLVTPPAPVVLIVVYLAGLNFLLAAFNMLPAFPLDGGRLLRAFLAMRMPFGKATNLAADIGKGMAVIMGLAGLFTSIWLILIAFFIYMGASQEAQGVELFDALKAVEVREIMDPQVPAVGPDGYVDDLVPVMLRTRSTGFPVVDHGEVVGVVTLSDLQKVPEDQRALVRIRQAMTTDIATIAPDERANEALRLMMDRDIGRLLVIESGELKGVVTRGGIMQAFQILKAVPKVEVRSLGEQPIYEMDVVEERGHDPDRPPR